MKNSPSLYLRQHAVDLVDWYSYQPEAFVSARQENKPILLSIGFSACHWCHVMQSQSFLDPPTAKYMNEHFINILLDREARPDLDALYAGKLDALSGRLGWPMTLFLRPDGQVFFAGTYYPPGDERMAGSFRSTLAKVERMWSRDRRKVDELAARVEAKSASHQSGDGRATDLNSDNLHFALDRLLEQRDKVYGGLTQGRKYPLPAVINLAMGDAVDQAVGNSINSRQCHSFYATTLDAMAIAQIHDQVGGGFFRYATNQQWQKPHFEKMLNDNASIAMNYFRAAELDHNTFWQGTAFDTVNFILKEMLLPDGTFAGSLDADSPAGEGAYYTFTFDQAKTALSLPGRDQFIDLSNFSQAGNCGKGANLPCFASVDVFRLNRSIIASGLADLRRLRLGRQKPLKSASASAAWNGLAISAIVRAHQFKGAADHFKKEQLYLPAAKKAARALLDKLFKSASLLHGQGSNQPGFLDDYAFFESAMLDLYAADGDKFWLERALQLDKIVHEQYYNPATHSFRYQIIGSEGSALAATTDGVNLSAAAAAVRNLIRLAALPNCATRSKAYLKQARDVLQASGRKMQADPVRYGSMLEALQMLLAAER